MSYTRTTDRDLIEHRLLELAYTTDAKITAPALAYFAPCSFEDAESVLDALTARERIRMDIDEDGTIVYFLPDRQRMPRPAAAGSLPPTPPAPASPSPGPYDTRPRYRMPAMPANPFGLVRQVQRPLAMRPFHGTSPMLAAALSMFLPGAGQLYAGRLISALMWFMVVGAGYALILPGLVLHFFCIVSAAGAAHRTNATLARMQLAA